MDDILEGAANDHNNPGIKLHPGYNVTDKEFENDII